MKTARFRGFEKGFVIEEAPKPEISDDEVLIRVKCCAISGTDTYRFRKYDKPVIMPFSDGDTPGHEASGIVEAKGKSVKKLNVGDRVVVQPFWGCGVCEECRKKRENFCTNIKAYGFHVPGVFSEYIKAREDIALRFNERLSFKEAVPTHHMAVNLYGLKSSDVSIGEGTSAAVFGTGNLGLLMVMQLKALNVSKIFAVDIDPAKLKLASELSGSIPVNAKNNNPAEIILKETDGKGVAVSIELAGGNAPTIEPAIKSTRKGGAFIALAVRNDDNTINFRQVLSKSLRVQGASAHTIAEMQESLKMIEEGKVATSKIITHRFHLEDVNEAFNLRIEDPSALYVIVEI